MKKRISREKFLKLLKRGEVHYEDFLKLYPNRKESSAKRTARYYMFALESVGLAQRNGKGWEVRTDLLKVIERFEHLRRKLEFEGDLFEFISVVFEETKGLLKSKVALREIAKEKGVDEGELAEFVREFLEAIEWKDIKDLKGFLRDFKNGNWVYIVPEVVNTFRKVNAQEILQLKERGFNTKEATIVLMNALLGKVPLSLDLWEKVERDAPAGTGTWVEDRLAERKGIEGVELVPVDRRLYEKLQREVSELSDEKREVLKQRLVKRLNSAVEKTIKDAKEMRRRSLKK